MNSPGDDYEFVDYPPREHAALETQVSLNFTPEARPSIPLTSQRFHQLLDLDGRLVDEHSLRHETFTGGIESDVRAHAWRFLFELFPVCSTYRERDIMLVDYLAKYLAMRSRWRRFVQEDSGDFDKSCEDRLLAPSYLDNVPETCDLSARPPQPNTATSDQWPAMQIQAQIHAGRHQLDPKSFVSAVRIIDKDVPRTDRGHQMFSGASNPHLRVLRDILVTYAAFHPDVGYAQGMNDIAARFLIVLQSEVEAYWCFCHYMDKVKTDFVEDGVLNKLTNVQQLLQELEPDMLRYLQTLQIADMTFCHRWMLLCFKREFSDEDALKCFEMLCCHHLEVDSIQAQHKLEKAREKNFQRKGGLAQLAESSVNVGYTFDVFMCVAILIMHREQLFDCQDTSDVFALISSLTMKLNLHETMMKAEEVFHLYCKKSALDSFELVDMEPLRAKPTSPSLFRNPRKKKS